MDSLMNFNDALMDKTLYLNKYTEYVKCLYENSNKDKIREFSELRKIDLKAIENAGIFYIDNQAAMVIMDFYNYLKSFGVISNTNNKPIFHDRWVIPIKNTDGKVLNLVGYSNQAAERYIYATGQYYMRNETLWGLENLDIAYELGYAIITEGITDALHIRSVGYPNTYGMCGTGKGIHKLRQLNRLKYGIIRITDRDYPGERTKSLWITNRYLTLNTPVKYKDSDETLKHEENIEWFKQYLDLSIEWITNKENKGFSTDTLEVTMI